MSVYRDLYMQAQIQFKKFKAMNSNNRKICFDSRDAVVGSEITSACGAFIVKKIGKVMKC